MQEVGLLEQWNVERVGERGSVASQSSSTPSPHSGTRVRGHVRLPLHLAAAASRHSHPPAQPTVRPWHCLLPSLSPQHPTHHLTSLHFPPPPHTHRRRRTMTVPARTLPVSSIFSPGLEQRLLRHCHGKEKMPPALAPTVVEHMAWILRVRECGCGCMGGRSLRKEEDPTTPPPPPLPLTSPHPHNNRACAASSTLPPPPLSRTAPNSRPSSSASVPSPLSRTPPAAPWWTRKARVVSADDGTCGCAVPAHPTQQRGVCILRGRAIALPSSLPPS